jgi:hypothetical protein
VIAKNERPGHRSFWSDLRMLERGKVKAGDRT